MTTNLISLVATDPSLATQLISRAHSVRETIAGRRLKFVVKSAVDVTFWKGDRMVDMVDKLLNPGVSEKMQRIRMSSKSFRPGTYEVEWVQNGGSGGVSYANPPRGMFVSSHNWRSIPAGSPDLPILFAGPITMETAEGIVSGIENGIDGLPFSRWIISLINPDLTQTSFQIDLDSEIHGVRFDTPDGPLFLRNFTLQREDTAPSVIYQLTVGRIVEFTRRMDLTACDMESSDPVENYIDLVCESFNQMVAQEILSPEIGSPAYLEGSRLDTAWIKNKKTLELVRDPGMEFLFGTVASILRRRRTKEYGIVSADRLLAWNAQVDRIWKYCEGAARKGPMTYWEVRHAMCGDLI